MQEQDSIPGDRIVANIQGNVSGMVAVGKDIVQMQVHVEKGAVATIIQPEQLPEITPRSTPVQLGPRPFDRLLDRAVETGALSSDLLSGHTVEFFGGEGVGKTTLLRAAAHHNLAAAFPDGIVYLEMRDQTVDDLLMSLFDAFYETSRPYKPSQGELRQRLSTKNALILIDEVGAQRQPGELNSLVNTLPASTFLFASTEQRLLGEGCAYELAGLPADDALELFQQWVGRPLSSLEIPLGRAICANLAGNPLRIVQAAGLAQKHPRALAAVAGQMAETNPVKKLQTLLLAGLAPEEQQVLASLAALRGAPVHRKHLPGLTRKAGALAILALLLKFGLAQAHGVGVSLTPSMLAEVSQSMDIAPAHQEALRYFIFHRCLPPTHRLLPRG